MKEPHTIEDICPNCKGEGFTAEHDTPFNHGEDGECISCPVAVQCEICEGGGRILFTEVGKIEEVIPPQLTLTSK